MKHKYLLLLSGLLLLIFLANCSSGDGWRTASRQSAGIAPAPMTTQEPVVHVYGARAWGWRGKRGMSVLRIAHDLPDRLWFGEQPELLVEPRGAGAKAEKLIEEIDQAARAYPWKETYKVFPGPNNNTFTAWVAQQVPELNLKLPFRAIGSGYLN